MPVSSSWTLSTPAPATPADTAADNTRDALGKDIFFNGDFQITAGGDYATIEGFANLRRAILRRLTVRPGEFRLRPNYGVGVGNFVKKIMSKANLDELKHRIIENLAREPRIEKVESIEVVKVTFDNGHPGLLVHVAVRALGQALRFEPFSFVEVS